MGSVRDIFFFNDTATTEIYTLSLHAALPIYAGRAAAWPSRAGRRRTPARSGCVRRESPGSSAAASVACDSAGRSEEHTSELQSRQYLVCRLLLEKKTP